MKRNHLIVTLLFFISRIPIAQAKENLPAPFEVIPQPQDVELLTGRGVNFGELKTMVHEGDFKRLMLALEQSDYDDHIERKAGLEAINKAMNDFNRTWYNLTNVYRETRNKTYPPNYVPDRYFHFASQREDPSWMIQTEQLLHQKFNDWIND